MDQTKYVNTFIETIMGKLHECLGETLHLKVQIKLLQESLREKEENLVAQNQQKESDDTLIRDLMTKAEEGEAYKNKAAHVDSLLQQVRDMKKTIQELGRELQEREKSEENWEEITEPQETVLYVHDDLPPIDESHHTDDVINEIEEVSETTIKNDF